MINGILLLFKKVILYIKGVTFAKPTLMIFIPIFLVSWPILFLYWLIKKPTYFDTLIEKYYKKWISLGAYIGILNYIILGFLYLINENYVDHAEANVASVSWLFQTGYPLYPELGAATRYINNYGPVLYVINGFFLSLLHPSIFSSKFVGVIAAFLSLGSIYYTLKKDSGAQIAIIYCAYIALIFLSLTPVKLNLIPTATFWNRPDPLLMMCVSVGLLGVVRTSISVATLLCTLFLGISLNLKLFAALYFLPIYIILYLRCGIYYTLASVLCSTIIAVIPFFCFSQVSLENYIQWLGKVSHQSLKMEQLQRNIDWVIYLFIPAIILLIYLYVTGKREFNKFINQNKIYICALVISIIAVVIVSSKSGALENNLVPLMPASAYLFMIILSKMREVRKERLTLGNRNTYLNVTIVSTSLALLISTIICVTPNEHYLIRSLKSYPNAINDIYRVVKSYPATTIGMGYGKTYELSFYRPLLLFLGNPYLVDAASLMEMQESGIDYIPSSTLTALASCQTKIWLIPKGETPFELQSYYPPEKQLFTDKFKATFFKKYELKGSTKYYDLWFCKDKSL